MDALLEPRLDLDWAQGDTQPRERRVGAMTEPVPKKPFLPPRWFVRLAWFSHRSLYRLSRGRLGLRQPGPDRFGLMRLTTTGRRTGRERHVMLGYIEDGSDLVTLAMNGWGPDEPGWWLNLQAHPGGAAELPTGPRKITGRVATGDDRERLWARWRELDDNLDNYASLRPAETAVVVLETTG